ncbi:MAG: hypothetical protein ACRCWM_09330 [Sarcina sp.]
MKELVTTRDLTNMSLPTEVEIELKEVLLILDEEYGEDRDKVKDLGGYVTIFESKKEVEEYKIFNIDFRNTEKFEYVDEIICGNGEVYIKILIVLGSDYNLVMIIKNELATEEILEFANKSK